MYEVRVTANFSSAHFLRGYLGKCENLHGHNWKVEAAVKGGNLNKIGILADFKQVKQMLNEILSQLDHKNLNEIVFFRDNNPSSENLAFYVFKKMQDSLKGFPGLSLSKVKVWEQENSCAVYYE